MTGVLKPDCLSFESTDESWVADRAAPIYRDFTFEESDDRFTFGPMQYRGRAYRVSLAKELLRDGAVDTQMGWSSYLQKQELWRLPSVPLQIAYISLLMQHSGDSHLDPLGRAQSMVWDDLLRGIMSGSRVRYSMRGFDGVTHEYGTADVYDIPARIRGRSELISTNAVTAKALHALTGVRDIATFTRFNQVFKSKNIRLSRQYRTPVHNTICVLGLRVPITSGLVIDACLSNRWRAVARGVALEEIILSREVW